MNFDRSLLPRADFEFIVVSDTHFRDVGTAQLPGHLKAMCSLLKPLRPAVLFRVPRRRSGS